MNDIKAFKPWFCPCEDPETGEKCNNMMGHWDQMFYEKYGMCQECFEKYNPQVKAIEEELEKQT